VPDSELDRLDPDPVVLTLESGLQVEVVRIKTRQFFRLLKVLTHGAGQALIKSSLDFGTDGAEFAQRMMSLVLISIPDAESETIEFVQSMVRPHGLAPGPQSRLTKQQREANEEKWTDLSAELFNPELDDIVTIVEQVVRQEAADIQALGKRLASLLELARKTGAGQDGTPEETPEPEELETASQDLSPGPSTSSAPSTDGATNGSSGSRSAASARSPRPSAAAARPAMSSASG